MYHTATYIGLGWMLTGVTVMVVALIEELAGPVRGGWVGLSAVVLLIASALVLLWARLTASSRRAWMALPTLLIGGILLLFAIL